MKELKRLARRIHWCECIHLGLMTLGLTCTLALLFKEDDPLYRLLWAIGAVIPVQLIRWISERVKKIWLRILLCLAAVGVTLFVTRNDYHWVYYVLAMIPILISGLFLPRPNGKLVLTVPNVIWLLSTVLPYAVGQVTQVPLLSRIAIAIAALETLIFFLHFNQSRLLTDIRMSIRTEVSVTGLIRQNRKVVAIFVLVGILILSVIPFLLRAAPPQTQDVREEFVAATTPEPTPTPEVPKNYMLTRDDKPINLNFLPYLMSVFGLAPILLAVGLIYLIYSLISGIDRRKKHALPEIEETMTIEHLEPNAEKRQKEHLSGYEKKIRRHYEKLIRSRAPKKMPLKTKTPTELEQVAQVSGSGAETIHEIYRSTRYSPEPATKERYAAFKEAIRSLPVPSETKDEPQ